MVVYPRANVPFPFYDYKWPHIVPPFHILKKEKKNCQDIMSSSCNLDSMMLLLKHPFYLPAALRAITFHFIMIA